MHNDQEIKSIIAKEFQRQQDHLELIASENYASTDVMAACGSILTNKYAEGYPSKRYYGGCQYVDQIEELACMRLQMLFGASYANVQPHSGSQANAAVFQALLNYGDKVLAMSLDAGGHLTHGAKVNFSGKQYNFMHYGVDANGYINYEQVAALAKQHQPKLIIAGFSAYSRIIDWHRFRTIADEVGAYLLVDMAHVAGLVAAGLYPNPVPIADVVTSTTHKTLRGPRGGVILAKDQKLAKLLNSAIFPGLQGGPLMHVIAAKAISFKEAMSADFKEYQQQVITNAKAMYEVFASHGIQVVSNGTDNHLLLLNLQNIGISGKLAEEVLDRINITVNKNTIPNDPASPFVTSGIRIGTPAITTRGMQSIEAKAIATYICQALKNVDNEPLLLEIKQKVIELCDEFPIYQQL